MSKFIVRRVEVMLANYSLKDLNISSSDGEKEVKKYACTYLKSKLIGLQASGTLAVTNKRVIFKASGSSASGQSILQSETPLEDVSGISVYKGTYFNIKHLIIGIIISIIGFFVWTVFINAIPFGNNGNAQKVVLWISAVVASIALFSTPKNIFAKSISGSIAFSSFIVIAAVQSLSNLASFESSNSNMKWVWILAIAVGIVTFVFLILSCRRETMSLAIGSKGGSNTPIYIAGVSSWSVSNNAAVRAIEAEPDKDAEIMIKELGALILDLQHKGDYGIENWLNQSSNSSPSTKKVEIKGDSWICPKCNTKNEILSRYCKECGTYK